MNNTLAFYIKCVPPVGARKCCLQGELDNIIKTYSPFSPVLPRHSKTFRDRGSLSSVVICMHTESHSFPDCLRGAVIAAPTNTGLRGDTFKAHRQPSFSVRVVPHCNKLPEETASASSMETRKTWANPSNPPALFLCGIEIIVTAFKFN